MQGTGAYWWALGSTEIFASRLIWSEISNKSRTWWKVQCRASVGKEWDNMSIQSLLSHEFQHFHFFFQISSIYTFFTPEILLSVTFQPLKWKLKDGVPIYFWLLPATCRNNLHLYCEISKILSYECRFLWSNMFQVFCIKLYSMFSNTLKHSNPGSTM